MIPFSPWQQKGHLQLGDINVHAKKLITVNAFLIYYAINRIRELVSQVFFIEKINIIPKIEIFAKNNQNFLKLPEGMHVGPFPVEETIIDDFYLPAQRF